MGKDIIIVNEGYLKDKIKKIKEDGKEKVHFLTDFDRTLTRAFYNSKKSGSIISYLRNGNYLTKDYSPKAHALFDAYHPIEINPEVSKAEKNKKMHEWWKSHMELLIESGFDRETLKKCVSDMIKENALEFREGVEEFLKTLDKEDIPLVVISSSLGDLIKEFLKQKKVFYKNISVIGNNFIFDKNGKAIGNEKIIHVFNKNEFELHKLPIYNELLKRKNVVLLGDSTGDLGMVEGFPYKNLIKIGFLNENANENLEEYKKNFDVVIMNDPDFSFVNNLLKKF